MESDFVPLDEISTIRTQQFSSITEADQAAGASPDGKEIELNNDTIWTGYQENTNACTASIRCLVQVPVIGSDFSAGETFANNVRNGFYNTAGPLAIYEGSGVRYEVIADPDVLKDLQSKGFKILNSQINRKIQENTYQYNENWSDFTQIGGSNATELHTTALALREEALRMDRSSLEGRIKWHELRHISTYQETKRGIQLIPGVVMPVLNQARRSDKELASNELCQAAFDEYARFRILDEALSMFIEQQNALAPNPNINQYSAPFWAHRLLGIQHFLKRSVYANDKTILEMSIEDKDMISLEKFSPHVGAPITLLLLTEHMLQEGEDLQSYITRYKAENGSEYRAKFANDLAKLNQKILAELPSYGNRLLDSHVYDTLISLLNASTARIDSAIQKLYQSSPHVKKIYDDLAEEEKYKKLAD